MNFSLFQISTESALVKRKLADAILQEILAGKLAPGTKIVESDWARRLGVSKASVREAINILNLRGFVEKGHGRSARVIRLTTQDLAPAYVFRAALEGTAARLIVEGRLNIDPLREAYQLCETAATSPDVAKLIESVLHFHLTLCECSGNRYIYDGFKRVFVPVYAFTLIRAVTRHAGTQPWSETLPIHRRIIEAIESGDALFAEQYVRSVIASFSEDRHKIWPAELPDDKRLRRTRSSTTKNLDSLSPVVEA